MRTFIFICLALLIGGGIVWGFVASGKSNQKIATYSISDPAAPKAEVKETAFDFGSITVSDTPSHSFEIKNSGKNPLVISDIMTSCHCTSAKLKISGQPDSPEFGMMEGQNNWQASLDSGQSAQLEVIYKPAVMPVKGQVSRVVTFNTNDPQNKTMQLQISANVQ